MILVAGALSFGSPDKPVVELALSISSITYGGLLGVFILGGISSRTRQRDAITAISVATVAMLVIVFAKPGPFANLAWPWYVPLGTLIAVGTGLLTSTVAGEKTAN